MTTFTQAEPEAEFDCRVLYVDDDPEWRATLPVLLEAKGYQVETARDGSEAWIRICTAMQRVVKGFDLVITDLDMPKLDGIELIRRVRGAGFTTRILVYARALNPEQRIELNALLVDAAVEKGMETKSLLNLIRKVVDPNAAA